MDTPDTAAEQPAPKELALAEAAARTSYRDQIIDRTGDAVRALHETAGDLHRALVSGVNEPDTDTRAIVIAKPNGEVVPLPASFFDDYREHPKHRHGTAVLTRIESFIDHVNRFKDDRSAIFADDSLTKPSLTAVIDYHEAGSYNDVDPAFNKHRAHFAFPLAPEWKTWLAQNGKSMRIHEFAEFLEENFVHVEQVLDFMTLNADIQHLIGLIGREAVATPTKLLKLSQGLTIHENAQVANHKDLSSGESEISFKTEHTDELGQKINIPKLFILNIPVFARGDLYRVAARLRYAVRAGVVTFTYELWGIDRVFEMAFVEACGKAAEETGLPLFYGAPETGRTTA